MEINSEEYWENRFKTDWKENFGHEQTHIHYTILLDYLPKWIKKSILDNNYSICDMGCGMGEGTNEIHKSFPKSQVYGMDFSDSAIEYALNNFKQENLSYFVGDILNSDRIFDVIILSHTLEHFSNPFEIMGKLSKCCKYLIITVPFREKNLWKEHLFSFDYTSFPIKIDNKQLCYFKEIEPIFFDAGNYKLHEQILVIYANEDFVDDFSLENMNSYYDETLILKEKINKLKKRNKELKKENDHFKSTKAYKVWKKFAKSK